MNINLTGVEVQNFLKEPGSYTLKVISVKDGKNKSSYEEELTVNMRTKEGFTYTEKFLMRDTMVWKIAAFVDALKLPMSELDSNVFVGRFVNGFFENGSYTDGQGNPKTILKASSWSGAKMQEETVPPPVQKPVDVVHENIQADTNDDERIPF